jgi:hypothetical protein
MADQRPSIIIHGFETTYRPELDPVTRKPTGKMKEVDWVRFSPTHSALLSQIKERVDFMRPENIKASLEDDDNNGGAKVEFFRYRWDMIERAYKAWKEGHEIPIDGTPLAAWPGLNKAQAEVFRALGIKSVEQIAEMTDSIMQRVQLPGVRDIRTQAQAFLEASDRNSTANRLTQLEAQNGALQEQLEAAMELLKQQAEAAKLPVKKQREKEAA